MPKLKEVIISITNRCNFKCRMCDIPKRRNEEASTRHWKEAIKDACSLGAQTIVFSGGEPLLREDIFDLISFVKNSSMNACLASNGYFIDAETANKLHQAGVCVVNVSIEGDEKIHDYLRGSGAYKKAEFALGNLRRYKIETTIATMVCGYNYKYLVYIVELAKKYGITTIKFQPFSNIFIDNGLEQESFFISDMQISEVKWVISEVMRLCNNYGISTNPSSYLERIPFYLSRRDPGLNSACDALQSSCPINCKGEIYPCWALTGIDKLIGSIKEGRFLNLWNSQKRSYLIEKIQKEGCSRCMMSCYDEIFGREPLEKRIVISAKRLKREGPYEYLKHFLKRWKKRVKFYSSYRGPLIGIINKRKALFSRKRALNSGVGEEEIDKALEEICTIKQTFEEELKKSI